jgi:glycerol-3-phosphate dehydrogenase (NAD(P)+)
LSQKTLSVIGGGSWGTALAHLLIEKGYVVRLWVFEKEVVRQILEKRENETFLPGIYLNPSLHVTNSLEEALEDSSLLVFSVPSHFARGVLSTLAPLLSQPVPIVSATKGIETDSLSLMTDVMKQTLPSSVHPYLAVLSGPSFAREVAQGSPTLVTLASENNSVAQELQGVFTTPCFRVYTSSDLVGVQIGGALKNVMAIAAGVADGLGLGFNSRAALITRGLLEITRLGTAMGGEQQTFYGLSGIGDLILTCTGELSRNRRVGFRLGEGVALQTILQEMHMVAEGVRTTQAAHRLAQKFQVRMPIVSQVHALLFEGKDPQKALRSLMEGPPGDETGAD